MALLASLVIGSIEPGKSADMVFLDRNPLTIPVSEVKKVKLLKTMFEDRVVYQAGQSK
jgi:predicted amidohydrolase YtcJ